MNIINSRFILYYKLNTKLRCATDDNVIELLINYKV